MHSSIWAFKDLIELENKLGSLSKFLLRNKFFLNSDFLKFFPSIQTFWQMALLRVSDLVIEKQFLDKNIYFAASCQN